MSLHYDFIYSNGSDLDKLLLDLIVIVNYTIKIRAGCKSAHNTQREKLNETYHYENARNYLEEEWL
jgi:hypothetical protein